MKRVSLFFAMIGAFALLFYACSKDDGVTASDEKATLSFGAILQDLADKSSDKQSDLGDIPACSDDTPAYVEIVLMQGDTEVVGSVEEPFRVNLVAGQVFTEEVPELELDPGTYSLEHFSVYNDTGDLIWLAPKGGVMANFVDHALPVSINLGAGVKKYVDVSVLCYDDRDVNQYGYQFFELDATEAFEFCFFANYCPPDNPDRHYVANYSVNIWLGTDDTGEVLYSDVSPVTGVNEDGDFYAEPACFVLPANDDLNEEYLYYEVTVLDWPDNYGTAAPGMISGTLSAQDVMDNFDGEDNVEYEHLRFNCEGETPPPPGEDSDNDGVQDDDDNCPNDPNPDQQNSDGDSHGDVCDNCPMDDNEDQMDGDGDGIGDVCDNCPEDYNPNQMDTDGDGIGNACDPTPGGDDGDDHGDIMEGCETAIMFGDNEWADDLELTSNRWGWAEHFVLAEETADDDGVYRYQIWAAAGQNDTSKGYWVGNVEISIDDEGDYHLEIVPFEEYDFNDIHVYLGNEAQNTVAPGQFDNTDEDDLDYELDSEIAGDGNFWLAVHVVACNED